MDDDTTNLISELLQKLADHQRQIDSFCRAQAQVFTRYQNEVLENAPRHVSSKVEEAIARTLHKYPALKSGFEQLQREQREQREQRQEQLSWPKPIQRRSRRMRRRRKDSGNSSNVDIIVSVLLTHIYHH